MLDTTVILANGDYPTHQTPLSFLQTANRVVCCDGAANEYVKQGHMPDVVIGDCDSLHEDTRKKLAGRIVEVEEQDDNDLTKAFNYVMSHWPETSVYILGASGKRDDHFLGNLGHLIDFADRCRAVSLVNDYGIFTPHSGTEILVTRPGEQISVFNINCQTLSSVGLRWPICAFTKIWEGTLNEALGHEVTIKGDGKYLVYKAF